MRVPVFVLVLLFVLLLVIRIPNTFHETGVDSFSLHGVTNSVIERGYLQNYHVLSLTGMYPLSISSAEIYLLAFVSLIAGLSVEYSVLVISIVMGLVGSLGAYLVGMRLRPGVFAVLFAFFFGSSVYFTLFTRFSTTNRIMFVIFLPFLFLLADDAVRSRGWRLVRDVVFTLGIMGFMFLTHRMAQLLVLVVVAMVVGYFLSHWQPVVDTIRRLHVFRFFKRRYMRPRMVLFDVIFLGMIVVILKIIDLASRGRFFPNFEKYAVGPAQALAEIIFGDVWIATAILTVFVLSFVVMTYVMMINNRRVERIGFHGRRLLERVVSFFRRDAERAIAIILLGLAIFLFLSQFINPITNLDVSEFESSQLIQGSGVYVNIINLIINYSTGVNVFFICSFFGFGFLLFKKEKSFLEYALLLTFIMLLPLLINKRYVRAFSLPFVTLMIAVFFDRFVLFLHKRWRPLASIALVMLLVLSTAGTLIFVHRQFFLGSDSTFQAASDQKIMGVADWMRGQPQGTVLANVGIVETKVSAYAEQKDMSKKIPDLLEDNLITIELFSWSEIWEKMKRGESKELGRVEDWMFPGQYYYSGRHHYFISTKNFDVPLVRDFIEAYNIIYVVDQKDFDQPGKPFVRSVWDTQNRLYDGSIIVVWDAQRGRIS